jgi:hypothetical protein
MNTLRSLALLLACLLGGSAHASAINYPYIKIALVQVGDNPQWADPTLDDSQWETVEQRRLDPQDRLLWVRAHVTLPPEVQQAGQPLHVRISAVASYEVFWNGVPIGRNGMPGTSAALEEPGFIDGAAFVPRDLLREGVNVLALRMSSFHLRGKLSSPVQGILLGPYGSKPSSVWPSYMLALFAGGALLLGAAYFCAMFLVNRRDTTSLLLSLLSCAVLGQLLAETSRLAFSYRYPLHLLRLEAILGFAALSSGLLVAYVAQRYARRWLWHLVAGAAAAMLACAIWIPSYDGKTTCVVLAALATSLVTVFVGIRTKVPGAAAAAAALVTVIAWGIFDIFRFIDRSYYVAVAALLLFLFVQHATALRRAERIREQAELRSARLELELLKQQIQPHFLMNTLTTLTELIESEPAAGVRMIEALADELRAIAAMVGQTTVPMRQELELCRHHLKLMSFRRSTPFDLRIENVDLNARVPPGIFHTLIENALTHNRYAEGAIFRLEESVSADGSLIYRLRTPLSSSPPRESRSGKGHAYVRARLKDVFENDWLFSSQPQGDHEWIDELQIRRIA